MEIVKKYANPQEVAHYTGIARKTIYDWAAQGRLPSIKIGRKVLFDLADIDDLMSSLKRTRNRTAENNNKAAKTGKKILGDINDNNI